MPVMGHGMAGADGGAPRRLFAWLASWTVGRPDDLADTLIDDIDRDLEDMRLITRHDAGPDMLLPERLRLAGRDVALLERQAPELLGRLEANCRACPHWRRCAREIACGIDRPGDHCANADLLRS